MAGDERALGKVERHLSVCELEASIERSGHAVSGHYHRRPKCTCVNVLCLGQICFETRIGDNA
jgi:hypothetical protein